MLQGNQILNKYNPATGQLIRQYLVTTPKGVEQVVQISRQLFPVWSVTQLSLRRKVLQDVARQIREQSEPLSRLISEETGKPLKESIESDLTTAVSVLNYYASVGPKLLKPKRLPLDKSLAMGRVHYEYRVPRGVVGIISPWNYPMAIPISGLSAALMAGNTAVLKPSELTPGVGEAIGTLFQDAFKKHNLPPEIVQVVIGDGTTGAALTQSDIDYAVFTGGDVTGCMVRDALQKRGKEACLELGGSDPMIVLEGADLDKVTSYALWGRFTNTGQTCAAVKRLFVPKLEQDEVVTLLKSKIETLRQGRPEEPGNHIGPLISERHLKDLESQVEDAISRGATVVTGGHRVPGEGWFYAPTLVINVPPDARLLTEEVFGPVLPVIPYESLEDAVQQANAHRYGLTGSVFGHPHTANEVAQRLDVGLVVINDVGPTGYALPSVLWSGRKGSGPGVSHGEQGLLELTHPKLVSHNWLYWMPFFGKPPWHFSKGAVDIEFSNAMLNAFGGQNGFKMLNPVFLGRFFRNRASRKI